MRIVPANRLAGVVNPAVTPYGFWQRLARMFDDYLVDRAKRTVPAAAFRRSRREIERCRRLMLKGSLTPAHSKVTYVPSRRAARAAPPSW
jgi:hypothetical protein